MNFLQDELSESWRTSHERKLRQLASNYLCIDEYELVRATLRQYYRLSAAEARQFHSELLQLFASMSTLPSLWEPNDASLLLDDDFDTSDSSSSSGSDEEDEEGEEREQDSRKRKNDCNDKPTPWLLYAAAYFDFKERGETNGNELLLERLMRIKDVECALGSLQVSAATRRNLFSYLSAFARQHERPQQQRGKKPRKKRKRKPLSAECRGELEQLMIRDDGRRFIEALKICFSLDSGDNDDDGDDLVQSMLASAIDISAQRSDFDAVLRLAVHVDARSEQHADATGLRAALSAVVRRWPDELALGPLFDAVWAASTPLVGVLLARAVDEHVLRTSPLDALAASTSSTVDVARFWSRCARYVRSARGKATPLLGEAVERARQLVFDERMEDAARVLQPFPHLASFALVWLWDDRDAPSLSLHWRRRLLTALAEPPAPPSDAANWFARRVTEQCAHLRYRLAFAELVASLRGGSDALLSSPAINRLPPDYEWSLLSTLATMNALSAEVVSRALESSVLRANDADDGAKTRAAKLRNVSMAHCYVALEAMLRSVADAQQLLDVAQLRAHVEGVDARHDRVVLLSTAFGLMFTRRRHVRGAQVQLQQTQASSSSSPSGSDDDKSDDDMFVASRRFVRDMLALLEQVCSFDATLSEWTRDAKFRFDVIDRIESDDAMLVERMLTPPDALLAQSVIAGDMATATRIMDFFELTPANSRTAEASQLVRIFERHSTMLDGASRLHEQLPAAMPDGTTSLQRFAFHADLALASSSQETSAERVSTLLDVAKTLLADSEQRDSAEALRAFDVLDRVIALHSAHVADRQRGGIVCALDRLAQLGANADEDDARVQRPDAWPLDALEHRLASRCKRWRAVSMLAADRCSLDVLRQALTPAPGDDDGEGRLARMSAYVDALVERVGRGVADGYEVLAQRPGALVARMFFGARRYADALSMARDVLGLDPLVALLGRLESPAAAAAAATSSSSASSSEHSREYVLCDESLAQLRSLSPMVAALAALLKAPRGAEERFFGYALEATADRSELHRWVSWRVQAAYAALKLGDSAQLRALYASLFDVHVDAAERHEALWRLVVDRKVLDGELADAYRLATANLRHGPPDYLLQLLVERRLPPAGAGASTWWRHVRALCDKRAAAAQVVLDNVRAWPIDVATDMLRMCVCHVAASSDADGELGERVRQLNARVLVFAKIVTLPAAPWPSWQTLSDECERDVASVVRRLIAADRRRYDLATELARLYGAPSLHDDILLHQLRHQLLASKSTADARQTLASLPAERTVPVASRLLEQLRATLVANAEPPPALHRRPPSKSTPSLLIGRSLALSSSSSSSPPPPAASSVSADLRFLKRDEDEGERQAGVARICLFLTRHLLDVSAPAVDTERLGKLECGLRALLQLDRAAELWPAYVPLVGEPRAMVTRLMRDGMLAELAKVLADVESLRDDDTLVKHALKMLCYRRFDDVGRIVADFGSDAPLQPWQRAVAALFDDRESGGGGDDDALAVPAAQRRQRRRRVIELEHGADSSMPPDVNLAQGYLQLCSSPNKVALACLKACDNLSLQLALRLYDRFLLVHLMQRLLNYAKMRLLESAADVESAASISLCNSFLSRVDLLRMLMVDGSTLATYSLKQLSDARQVVALRNELVRQDRYQLALGISAKAGIACEPVYSAWGLSLLAAGSYNGAKDMLQKCLVPWRATPSERERAQRRRAGSMSSSSPAASAAAAAASAATAASGGNERESSQRSLLAKIVLVLETTPAMDAAELRSRSAALTLGQRTFSYEMQANAADDYVRSLAKRMARKPAHYRRALDEQRALGDASPPQLDAVRFMQCVYYLTRYGEPADSIRFWLRHNLVEDACRYVINKRLSDELFIAHIVRHCVARQQLPQLQHTLRRIDPTLRTPHPYLLALCVWLSRRRALTVLLDFQRFMSDHYRAALTCIKLFRFVRGDARRRLGYLGDARRLFARAAERQLASSVDDANADSSNPLLLANVDASELSRYERTIAHQIDVTKYFDAKQRHLSSPDVAEASLFRSGRQQFDIAVELIVLGNVELAFRIMQEYRLPVEHAYADAVAALARRKAYARLNDVFDHMRGTVPDEQADNVVMAAIDHCIAEHRDAKQALKFVQKLRGSRGQVLGYLKCGKLKLAYIAAVKARSEAVSCVQLVLESAQRIGQPGARIARMCETFLEANQVEQLLASSSSESSSSAHQD
jgi:hypothetical protein